MDIPFFSGSLSPQKVAVAIKEYGCAVLGKIVPVDILKKVIAEFNEYYPPWEDYCARVISAGRSISGLKADSDELQISGPFGKKALDSVPLLPEVHSVVAELIGPSALLQQSHLWAKYGQLGKEFDSPLHSDYSNHTFVYPSDDPRFQVVHAIAYYSDVTVAHGPTYVVPRYVSNDEILVPWFRDRRESAHFYDHEIPVIVPAGSILLYGTKLVHRASRMKDHQSRRLTHFFAFGPPDVPWLGWGRWLCNQAIPERQKFLESCSASDLLRIGFPSPSSEYWTDETIEGTSRLYPNLSLTEYLEKSDAE